MEQVRRMPAVGFERVRTTTGRLDTARPWFTWSGAAWTIDVALWRRGMIEGLHPPPAPSALRELLRNASPRALCDRDVPFHNSVAAAAAHLAVPLRLATRGAGRTDPSAVVAAGLPGDDIALIATAGRMVVISKREVHRWFFELAARAFSCGYMLEASPSRSRDALRLLSVESDHRLVPHLHTCLAALHVAIQHG